MPRMTRGTPSPPVTDEDSMTTPVATARDEHAVTTRPTKQTRLAIIATKGTLDWAYPPLMLAHQAAKKGWDVGIFFTFYGLNIIHRKKGKRLRVSPIGNPAMPVPMP